MKTKLLVLMLLVTVLALASQPAAKAIGLCPAYTCFQAIQACVASGGGPAEASIGETCYTLPSHTEYSIYIITCYHEESTTTFQECYR
jgi:uncharacterized membrane protein (GlpM family)